MFKVAVPNRIANAAAVRGGCRGDVSAAAAAAGCSRQTAYQHAARVQHAVEDAQLGGPTRRQLLAENTQLCDENQQLWAALEQTSDCPEEKLQQFAVTASACGLSLSQILVLLAILLPAERLPSRAAVGRWALQAARRAGRILEILDRLCRCLDRLHEQLQQTEPRQEVRQAMVEWWRLEQKKDRQSVTQAAVQGQVCRSMGEDWQESYQRVSEVLQTVVRAASAVECVNSVLRMQQERHRNISQEMRDLKRLYWNSRVFSDGKRKGSCPYQLLGVSLPTYDFWELLDLDPDKLAQELSNQLLTP